MASDMASPAAARDEQRGPRPAATRLVARGAFISRGTRPGARRTPRAFRRLSGFRLSAFIRCGGIAALLAAARSKAQNAFPRFLRARCAGQSRGRARRVGRSDFSWRRVIGSGYRTRRSLLTLRCAMFQRMGGRRQFASSRRRTSARAFSRPPGSYECGVADGRRRSAHRGAGREDKVHRISSMIRRRAGCVLRGTTGNV